MKKIAFILALLISSFAFLTPLASYAAVGSIEVSTTENVPGAMCSPDGDNGYTCHIPKGFGAVTMIMGEMVKYATFIAALGGVLYLVINGILYSMSGIDQGLKDNAKKRIVQTLLGLALLFLSGLILNMIAPWVYR